jgi:ABC-2 type transport system permease protein
VYFLLRHLLGWWRERRADTGVRPAPASVAEVRPESHRPAAAARGTLALLGHQVRYDLLAAARNPRARFFTIFFPVILLVILAGVFGSGHTVVLGRRVALARFYVPGILAMSIVAAAYANLVITITTLREKGVLKRRRATPVAPALLIAGQAITTLAIAAVAAVILLALGRLAYGIGFSGAALVALACTVIVGTLSVACVGYVVSGLIGNADAAQPVVQLTTLPLYFISGVFIPDASLSSTLRDIARIFPLEHLADAFQRASLYDSFAHAFSGTDLLVLAAWGIAAGSLAAWRFSWLPSAAGA